MLIPSLIQLIHRQKTQVNIPNACCFDVSRPKKTLKDRCILGLPLFLSNSCHIILMGQCSRGDLYMLLAIYGVCGSRNYWRFSNRAMDVKIGNAGSKLHWRLWEKSSFPGLTLGPYFLANNNGHGGDIWD